MNETFDTIHIIIAQRSWWMSDIFLLYIDCPISIILNFFLFDITVRRRAAIFPTRQSLPSSDGAAMSLSPALIEELDKSRRLFLPAEDPDDMQSTAIREPKPLSVGEHMFAATTKPLMLVVRSLFPSSLTFYVSIELVKQHAGDGRDCTYSRYLISISIFLQLLLNSRRYEIANLTKLHGRNVRRSFSRITSNQADKSKWNPKKNPNQDARWGRCRENPISMTKTSCALSFHPSIATQPLDATTMAQNPEWAWLKRKWRILHHNHQPYRESWIAKGTWANHRGEKSGWDHTHPESDDLDCWFRVPSVAFSPTLVLPD